MSLHVDTLVSRWGAQRRPPLLTRCHGQRQWPVGTPVALPTRVNQSAGKVASVCFLRPAHGRIPVGRNSGQRLPPQLCPRAHLRRPAYLPAAAPTAENGQRPPPSPCPRGCTSPPPRWPASASSDTPMAGSPSAGMLTSACPRRPAYVHLPVSRQDGQRLPPTPRPRERPRWPAPASTAAHTDTFPPAGMLACGCLHCLSAASCTPRSGATCVSCGVTLHWCHPAIPECMCSCRIC